MKYNSKTIVFFLHTTILSLICGYGSIDMRWQAIANCCSHLNIAIVILANRVRFPKSRDFHGLTISRFSHGRY